MQKTARHTVLALAVILLAALAAGCGSGNKETAGAATAAVSAPGGVRGSVQGVTIANGVVVVTFSFFDENGTALDPVAHLAANSSNRLRFVIARIKPDGNYENYIMSSGLPTYDRGTPLSSQFASLGGGVYTYTFSKNIDNTAQTLGTIRISDAGATARTHTVAIQIARIALTDNGKEYQQAANPYYNFRPDGGAVTVTREVTPISACNECHGTLGVHGGSRRDVAYCILCHYPGPMEGVVALDMKAMIHKIHMGEFLPSNAAGGDYVFGGSFKTVVYPAWSRDGRVTRTLANCAKCHKAGTDYAGRAYGADVAKYKSAPTFNKCATCHDTVTFDGSATITVYDNETPIPVAAYRHDNLIGSTINVSGANADNTALCSGCHADPTRENNEYDYGSVPSAHTIFEQSSYFGGLNYQFVRVDNAVANARPIVTYRITYDNGTAVNPLHADASFSIKLGFMPNGVPDYTNAGMNAYGQPFSTSLKPNSVSNGDGTYTITLANAIPAGATGVGVLGMEGRWTWRGMPGTPRHGATWTVNVAGPPVQYYFNVATGAQVTAASGQRRVSVDVARCNMCHQRVSFHGGGRGPNIQQCVICHNPKGVEDNNAINMKDMIHMAHTGEDLDDTQKPYFEERFAELRYPRSRMDCLACHVAATPASYGLPLPAGALGTAYLDDNTTRNPIAAACVSCHGDQTFTAPHVANQTSGTTELCTQCHTSGLLLGPDFAHVPIEVD